MFHFYYDLMYYDGHINNILSDADDIDHNNTICSLFVFSSRSFLC